MKTFLGTILVAGQPIYALFGMGATHSFITSDIVWHNGIAQESSSPLKISTSIGARFIAKMVVKEFPMVIKDISMPADLIVLNMSGYEVILGMD